MLANLMGSFIMGLLGVSFISQGIWWFTVIGAISILLGIYGFWSSLQNIGIIGNGNGYSEEKEEVCDKYHNPHIKSYQDAVRKLSFRMEVAKC